jgi:putative ABC transport system permease protein
MALAWRLALRDLRGGITGLRLLAICLFLGVAAIAGIGSLSSAIIGGLSAQGREILGGDVEVSLSQRPATPAERTELARLGRISESLKMRAMASRPDGSQSVLAELKSVDAAWPLYGRFAPAPGAIAQKPGPGQVAVAPALADRLQVRVGDTIRIGEAALRVSGIIAQEPDRVGEGFSFGPTAIVDGKTLGQTRLVQPGSLYEARYRIALAAGIDPATISKRLASDHGEAGWQLKDSSNGAPGTRRFVERIGQFLSLVGLTALLIAGIGVGNGVAAYLDGKRAGIATLKVLGASSQTIFQLYMIEIGLVAIVSIAAALIVGAFVPAIIAALAGDALPVPPRLALYPQPMILAAIYGLLVALAFSLAPIIRSRDVSAASLFRGSVDVPARPRWPVMLQIGGAILLAAITAIASAREPLFAAGFLGAAAVLLALLTMLGIGVRAIARRLPRPRRPLLRLALSNLHAPAAQTDRLIVALGLGLSLFATLAVVQTNLASQIRSTVPARAPGFFMLDIPSDRIDDLRRLVATAAPGSDLVTVPSLRGPVVALKGQRVSEMKAIPEGAWILRGDRGLTFARDLPASDKLTAGRWWPRDYKGPPLVSIDADAARLLDIRIGDAITVSALGVEVPATIASFRQINWDTMGLNFVLIFSPGTFDGAPFNYVATLALPPAREEAVNRAVTHAFPSVSLIRVKDVISTIDTLFGQLASAVAAASLVAIAAGIAVLIGAIMAARQARIYDAVLLKLLGATRLQILAVQAMEYALLALVVSLIALGVGAAGGWYVVVHIFHLAWGPDWGAVLGTVAIGAILTLGIGLLGSWPALAARPARALREL